MECADDAAAQAARRKAQMDERMAARAAEVEHQREVRKDGEDRSTRELVLAFESAFADGLARATGALGDALDVAALGDVSAAVQSLHQDVAAASTFLPAQTLERTTRSLAELEASARVKREQVAPKKRFAFKARDKLAPALPPAPGPGGAGAPAGARGTSVAANVAEPPLAPPAPPPARVPGHDGAEVRCRRGERLALAPPRGSGGDMALSELVDCDVTLLDGVAALWVDKLVRCRVVSLPIAGAVHINRCEGCEFHFASRQIRVHTTTSTDFYLHAGSHPIIEACTGLRFAPYLQTALVSDEAFAAAGLSKSDNLWSSVDDFLWLRTQQSPNWQALPEAERAAHDAAWAPLAAAHAEVSAEMDRR
ncbi:hypothetical protein KFE25_010869 [Diacronema lutheri]|uniref:C-CAP/cofactor C-like domain-containing protein n=1 Tax=Diacronema lutheri TaxID=2081491 RepID=A0A8J5XB23_DIALT|nr:hypothetical protein KFE25_010869 [Diacronema lutheri]